jgi:hypothetical protein
MQKPWEIKGRIHTSSTLASEIAMNNSDITRETNEIVANEPLKDLDPRNPVKPDKAITQPRSNGTTSTINPLSSTGSSYSSPYSSSYSP